jgi:hypothetical protein
MTSEEQERAERASHLQLSTDMLREQRHCLAIQFQMMKDAQERLEHLSTFAENVEILLPTLQMKIVNLIGMIDDLEDEVKKKGLLQQEKKTFLSKLRSLFR